MRRLRKVVIAVLLVAFGVFSTWRGLDLAQLFPGQEFIVVATVNILAFGALDGLIVLGVAVQWIREKTKKPLGPAPKDVHED